MRKWTQLGRRTWRSDDNAVVKIDSTTECSTSRPWLPNYRGWMAFVPGDSEFEKLTFERRNSRFKVVRKFKTAQAAMAAIDKEYPHGQTS